MGSNYTISEAEIKDAYKDFDMMHKESENRSYKSDYDYYRAGVMFATQVLRKRFAEERAAAVNRNVDDSDLFEVS